MQVAVVRSAAGMLFGDETEQFRRDLIAWFDVSKRDLPWRRTRDPYAIWISEIMLQQTRVAAVIPYYERFLTRFPDFYALANAPEAELLSYWAGLGYYYRARNMQKAAQIMTAAGGFPRTFDGIRDLPGVGGYTASAVASIAFNLPHAVLDGNVYRVLSRAANSSANIASSAGKKTFSFLADQLLDRDRPGAFNQAMMELGATVCLPGNPQCLLCPVSGLCKARQHGTQLDRPVNLKARKVVTEQRTVFWIEDAGRVLAWRRPPDARLMPGFWELPESEQLPAAQPCLKLGAFRHTITFHSYTFDVHTAACPPDLGPCEWLELDRLGSAPISTILKKAMRVANAHRDASATLLMHVRRQRIAGSVLKDL